ncbi:prenylated protein, putative [Plasmodium knowlesi strain H]|uniref:Prenylated protein, putative n=3 Tax=Plasmodium knowlesi TaxID=5850 RepID=A0A5K1U227_PLAKH|nr:SNARE protein, putative [Plasmodium knowlesi strain H]OTN67306.1 putative Prenylated protein [Plasmodium knowlesi]CAA9987376.1 SNARE protein, putative [Plasmodium knowlesi strain H]SBO23331.1 prenylated protein, putative [Plasmodium knowlesi strain H]SBO24435.1 prenylated protein, putative [Plasmodium knowlesi strain H]VVS76850.1 SNARE protein, putative [Plasmodium knowlesi strain H]|eukprot:XP_002258379.1 prenylated protein, putative [Plasmodium knowlesi strain H]
MNLLAIILTRHVDDIIFLCSATDLNAYSFIKKKAFKEAAFFVARTVPSRIEYNTKEIITHESNTVFAFKFSDNICPLVIATDDYPERVAFYMINEIYMDFIRTIPKDVWSEVKQDNKIDFNLNSYLSKYKDPLTCDAIAHTNMKISENIEKVRTTMDALIRNRENLDVLVDKSKDLSTTTKQLFKQSKKLKRKQCCRIM